MCVSLMAMSTFPSKIFCSSLDPCSCTGGGFDLYLPLCEARRLERQEPLNATSNATYENMTMYSAEALQHEYGSIFSFLGKDLMAVVVSVAVIAGITGIFILARSNLLLKRANKEKRQLSAKAAALHAKAFALTNQAGPIKAALADGKGADEILKILNKTWRTERERGAIRSYKHHIKGVAGAVADGGDMNLKGADHAFSSSELFSCYRVISFFSACNVNRSLRLRPIPTTIQSGTTSSQHQIRKRSVWKLRLLFLTSMPSTATTSRFAVTHTVARPWT